MKTGRVALIVGALAMAACAPVADTPAPAPAAAAPAGKGPVAGRTLACHTGGPVTRVTFGVDGKLSGLLMQAQISGTWRTGPAGSILIHARAGAVSLRDTLKLTAGQWKGRTTTCSNR